MKLEQRHERYVVLLVLLVAFLLRVASGISSPLAHNECEYLAVADGISFNPARANLPIGDERIPHPLLSLYVFKISSILFGESKIGFRMMNIIIGCLSLLLIYRLSKEFMGGEKAILAMILLCLNQFHIGWSRVLLKDIILISWSIVAVIIFLRALKLHRPNLLLLLGVVLGLGYLIKEIFPLLLVLFFLYSISSSEYRWLLKTKQFYLMILIMSLIICPRLHWSFTHFAASEIRQDLEFLNLAGSFSLAPLSFYFSPLFHKLVWPCDVSEFPVMDILSGLICIFGVVFSLRMRGDRFIRFMLIFFFLVFGVFTFLAPRAHDDSWWGCGEYWWVAITIIPGVILGANMLVELKRRYKAVNYVVLGIILLLLVSAWSFVSSVEHLYYVKVILPPTQAQIDSQREWDREVISEFLEAYPKFGNIVSARAEE